MVVSRTSNLTRHSRPYRCVPKTVAMNYGNWKNVKYFEESHTVGSYTISDYIGLLKT